MCLHEFTCVCLYVLKHCMKIDNESKMSSLLPSFILLKNDPQIAQFLVPQFSRKSCPWKIISVRVFVFMRVWCTVSFCVKQFFFVCVHCEQAACSRVDAEGQQFVRVQIVEGAQVWQAQEEFGEEGGVIWATASDQ